MNEVVFFLTLQRNRAGYGPRYEVDTTITFYPGNSVRGTRTPIASFTTRTDTSGTAIVQVQDGLDGSYDVVVKPSGAISRERNTVSFKPGVAKNLTYGPFDEGDLDGNDGVDEHDWRLQQPSFGRRAGQPGYEARADLDKDGIVTILDFSLLAVSNTLTGPVQQR